MQKYECKNCGAELKWSATAGALECEYCGEVYNPEDFEDKTIEADKSDEKEHLVDKEYATTSTTDEEVIYKCDECGAEVVALQTTMATECPYCGRPISLTHTHKGSFRPEKVVPYKIEKEEAIKLLKEFFGKSPFTPKEFKEQVQIEQVKGLYVPFYLHSYHLANKAHPILHNNLLILLLPLLHVFYTKTIQYCNPLPRILLLYRSNHTV